MQKRGISPLIATILIIAFTIVLGALIMIWGTDFFKTIQEEQGSTAETQLTCTTKINPLIKGNCNPTIPILNLEIKNDGQEKISSFLIRLTGQNSQKTIARKKSIDSYGVIKEEIPYDGVIGVLKSADIVPYVLINNKEKACNPIPITLEMCSDVNANTLSQYSLDQNGDLLYDSDNNGTADQIYVGGSGEGGGGGGGGSGSSGNNFVPIPQADGSPCTQASECSGGYCNNNICESSAPNPLTPGTTLTNSIKLNADINAVGSFVSKIIQTNADNIEIDCNNHKIIGDYYNYPNDYYAGIQIRNNGVTVKNCKISNVQFGIEIYLGANSNLITENVLEGYMAHGINIGSNDNTISNNRLSATSPTISLTGITVDSSSNNLVENNQLSGYDWGIVLNGYYPNTITNNQIRNNKACSNNHDIYLANNDGLAIDNTNIFTNNQCDRKTTYLTEETTVPCDTPC